MEGIPFLGTSLVHIHVEFLRNDKSKWRTLQPIDLPRQFRHNFTPQLSRRCLKQALNHPGTELIDGQIHQEVHQMIHKGHARLLSNELGREEGVGDEGSFSRIEISHQLIRRDAKDTLDNVNGFAEIQHFLQNN